MYIDKVDFSVQIKREIDSILDRVRKNAVWQITAESIDSSNLIKDKERLIELAESTREMADAVLSYDFYFLESDEVSESIELLKVKNILLQPYNIENIYRLFLNVKRFFNMFSGKADDYPGLYGITFNIDIEMVSTFISENRKFFTAEGHLDEDLFPGVAELTSKIFSKRNEILSNVSTYITGNSNRFDDTYHRFLDGRYLLPFKKEHLPDKNTVVQGISDSGQTFFAEPSWLVKLNNELRQLELEKKRVIRRFYDRVSKELSDKRDDLIRIGKTFEMLDGFYARAIFLNQNKAQYPIITDEIALYDFKNPLIEEEKVVSTDIFLKDDQRVFLVSGPNAGGKTVLLKSMFFSIIMNQLYIPLLCREGSKIRLFNSIYEVFGDESSILNSMSTFSSHISKLSNCLRNADNDSIIFIDEITSGTDPDEGTALAISIIENLKKRGCKVVVSTHLNRVKNHFFHKKGVVSVSMVFDEKLLSPVFKVFYDSINSSYALEIAVKNGLPEEIVEQSRKYLDGTSLDFRDSLESLSREREKYQRLNELLEEKKQFINKKENELYMKESKLKEKMEKELKNRLSQIEEEFQEYRSKARDKLENIKSKRDVEFFYEPASKVRQKLRKTENTKIPTKKAQVSKLEKGDKVIIKSIDTEAEFISFDGKEVKVNILGKDMIVPESDIALPLKSRKRVKRKSTGTVHRIERLQSTELNVLGQTVDEAIHNIHIFLEKAQLSGYEQVRIVHGKGKIRESALKYFDFSKLVRKHTFADHYSGGNGATIVYF